MTNSIVYHWKYASARFRITTFNCLKTLTTILLRQKTYFITSERTQQFLFSDTTVTLQTTNISHSTIKVSFIEI